MDYSKIKFEDEFEAEDDICQVCGNDTMPRVGYNEKKDLLKFECPECGAVFIEDGKRKTTMIKGEERDWCKYLAEHLSLPFEAVVTEISDEEFFGVGDPGPIRYEDKLKVVSVDSEVDLYGVLVSVKKGRKKYVCPLIELAPTDRKSANAKLIDNYGTWFSCQ